MTQADKEKMAIATKQTFISTVLASLILFSITSMTDDKKQLKKEMETKAPYEYVDKKCEDVKKESDKDKAEILDRLNTLDQKSNRILELMIKDDK